jgi:hypothetical protein
MPTKKIKHLVKKDTNVKNKAVNQEQAKEKKAIVVNQEQAKEKKAIAVNQEQTKEKKTIVVNQEQTKEKKIIAVNQEQAKEKKAIAVNQEQTKEKKIIAVNQEPPKERKCGGKCGQVKSINNFPKAKNNSGYSYWCNECSVNKSYYDPNIDPKTTKKKCKGQCGNEKFLTEFTKQKQGKYGYSNVCIECRKIARRNKTNINPNTIGTKICNGNLCQGKELNKTEFNNDKYTGDGLQSVCKKCQLHKTNVTYSKFDSFILKILNDCKSRVKKKAAKGRILEMDIDKDFIIDMYNKKKGKCKITGNEMTFNAINEKDDDDSCHIINRNNISIDRIDSSKGYTKDNVRLICAIINSIRFNLGDDEFYEICNKVVNPSKKNKVYDIYDIIESKDFLQYVNYKLTSAKFNAKAKKREMKLTEEDIIDLYKEQNGLCKLTKEKLSFDKGDDNALCFDRIDSNKGYAKNNVHLVTEKVNQLKSDLEIDEFKNICRHIVSKN